MVGTPPTGEANTSPEYIGKFKPTDSFFTTESAAFSETASAGNAGLINVPIILEHPGQFMRQADIGGFPRVCPRTLIGGIEAG